MAGSRQVYVTSNGLLEEMSAAKSISGHLHAGPASAKCKEDAHAGRQSSALIEPAYSALGRESMTGWMLK